MPRLAPLLLAYDGESPLCRRLVDWVSCRDRWGLVVTFPLQNAELPRVAPELAGRPLHLEIHAVDTESREVCAGAEVLPQILRRLPRWRLFVPLMRIPGVSAMARGIWRGCVARRRLSSARTPMR